MSEWISVEDQLPKEQINGQTEVVAFFNGGFWCGAYDHCTKRWFSCDSFDSVYSVTHWMPLPEPPK